MMKRLLVVIVAMLALSGLAFAQNVEVSGTIYDETNAPMIGAGVLQKGTTNGVATGLDGKYSLSLPAGSTLVVSSIGYTEQEFTVPANGGVIDVTMVPDTRTLEESVVVGYGVQKKSDLTGSISSVKSDDLEDRALTDAAQALQGKTAGVYLSSSSGAFGASSTVRIRGVGSNGSSDPLFVIDGRISPSGMSSLNTDDIESIEVLKDGASAAIYGARAGNGVILITTKSGKSDGRVTYQYQLGINTFSRLPKVMNAQEYKDYYTEAGTIASFSDWDGVTDTNWKNELTETSIMQRHTIRFEKGSKGSNIYLSANYMNADGPVIGNSDNFKSLGVVINGNWQFKKWLGITTNNQFTYSKRNSRAENVMLAIMRMDPLTKPYYSYDELPSTLKEFADDPTLRGTLMQNSDGLYYGISNYTSAGVANPLISLAATKAPSRNLSVEGSTAINLTPIKDLVVTSRLGYRFATRESDSTVSDYYQGAQNKRNWATVDATLNTPLYFQWETFANWSHSFGKHDVNAMVGTSYSQNRSYYITGEYTGAEDVFGFKKNDPNYLYWAYASPDAIYSLSGAEPIYTRNLSYYGRLSWNYANRYLA